jgi:hypothetical protein
VNSAVVAGDTQLGGRFIKVDALKFKLENKSSFFIK